MIVFTSDHGDYLGDHWLGEKDFFHDCAVKVPLIVADPRPQGNAARGSVVCEALARGVRPGPDLLEYFGNEAKPHVVEGQSLMPFLRGETPAKWRQCAFSEYDYKADAGRRSWQLESAARRLPGCLWSSTAAGNTSTRSPDLGRCSTIWQPDHGGNFTISAPTRGTHEKARGCARRCSQAGSTRSRADAQCRITKSPPTPTVSSLIRGFAGSRLLGQRWNSPTPGAKIASG